MSPIEETMNLKKKIINRKTSTELEMFIGRIYQLIPYAMINQTKTLIHYCVFMSVIKQFYIELKIILHRDDPCIKGLAHS